MAAYVTHTLTGNGFDASEDGTGRGTPLVTTFQERGREGGRSLELGGDVAYALTAPNGGGRRQEMNVCAYGITGCETPKISRDVNATLRRDRDVSLAVPAVAFAQNQRDEVRDMRGLCGALAAQPGMKQQTYLSTEASVRRLTPTEAERLQGFSWREGGDWQDGHTCLCGRNAGRSVGEEPCKCADGPRYRALGNAVAVPCVEWILRRVMEAERSAH